MVARWASARPRRSSWPPVAYGLRAAGLDRAETRLRLDEALADLGARVHAAWRLVPHRLTISLDDVSRNAGVFSNDSMSKRLQGKTTVEWLALTKQTIANKRRRKAGSPTTFFVDSGALRDLLIEYLGPAMATLVDPRIVVRKGPRRVSVTLSLMAQASGREKAGVTGQSFPGATGGASAREESLFVRYLKKAGAPDRDPKHPLAYKLENPRGSHRPFLQDTLVYWISRRLPLVLDKSLRSALAKAKKKKGK